jgi:Flp pilus assembly protein TadD
VRIKTPPLLIVESIVSSVRAGALNRAGTSPAPTIFHALLLLLGAFFILTSPHVAAQRRKPATATRTRARVASKPSPTPAPAKKTGAVAANTITVVTQPGAAVWLDEVRRGAANDSGELELKQVGSGRHLLRVRAKGFAERAVALPPTGRGRVAVPLTRATDEAELAFQEAEEARERATDEDSRRRAADLYRRAITLRPRYPAAYVGLARVLSDLGDFPAALDAVEDARKYRPGYAEASAVEGRIHHASGNDDAALEAYRRAVREGRGRQPEAHTGTGIILQEKGDYAAAAASFRKAVGQLADTEPVLYHLLGEALERAENYKDAVAAYEKYLELAPNGRLAEAVRSIIDQLRKQAAEQEQPPPDR